MVWLKAFRNSELNLQIINTNFFWELIKAIFVLVLFLKQEYPIQFFQFHSIRHIND